MTHTEEVKPSKSERVQMLWAKIFEVQNSVNNTVEASGSLEGNRGCQDSLQKA